MAQKMEPQAQSMEPWTQRLEMRAPENYFQALKPSGVCLAGFLHFGDQWLIFLPFPPVLNQNIYACLTFILGA